MLDIIKALLYYIKNAWIVGIKRVVVKSIIFAFFFKFGWLEISGDISLVFSMLASINDIGYFGSSSIFLFYIFILNNGIYSSCKKERYIC